MALDTLPAVPASPISLTVELGVTGKWTHADTVAKQETASVASTNVVLSAAIAVGDLVVVGWSSPAPDTDTVTANIGTFTFPAAAANLTKMAYCIVTTAQPGGTTITITGGGSGTRFTVADRYTTPSGSFLQLSGTPVNIAASGTSGNLGTQTGVPAGALLWGFLHAGTASSTLTAGSSQTVPATIGAQQGNAGGSGGSEYILAAHGGTESMTWTASVSLTSGQAWQAAFAITWTDISHYVAQDRADITVGRGKADEITTSTPSQATMTLFNPDGRFSAKNPTGPYYPYLTRNTPIRVSVPEGATYLRLEDDQVSYASAPSVAALQITGDTEIQLDVTVDNWQAAQILAGKWAETANQRTWLLRLTQTGYLVAQFSHLGSDTLTATSTVRVPVPAVRRQCLRVTYASATGTVTFYTAPPGLTGAVWTQLGATVVLGANTLFASTAALQVGYATDAATASSTSTGFNGKFHAFQLLNGIAGTVVANPDFTAIAAGTLTFTDGHANTFTLFSTAAVSSRHYVFWGEASSFPQAWDPTGTDVTIALQAGGLLRRYTQGTKRPLQSAFRRFVPMLANVRGYWPCEDGNTQSGGTTVVAPASFAAATAGTSPGTFSGSPTFASSGAFASSFPLPVFAGSSWSFAIPPRASGSDTANVLQFFFSAPTAGDTANVDIAQLFMTGGTVATLHLQYDTGGGLTFYGLNSALVSVFNSGPIVFGSGNANGQPIAVRMQLTVSGGTVTWNIDVQIVTTQTYPDLFQGLLTASNGFQHTGTFAGSIGTATSILANPSASAGLQSSAAGHFHYLGAATANRLVVDEGKQIAAWIGEPAGSRFSRLCAEQSVTFRGMGNLADTVTMGAQTPLDFPSLIQECIDADRGVLWEPRHVLALGYRTRASMQNQAAAVSVTYASADLAAGWGTTEDDQFTVNDAIVTNTYTGTSQEVTVTTGPLSTGAPPAGSNPYQQSTQCNLSSDALCGDLAGWVTWLGTQTDPRYPVLPVTMSRSEITSNASLYFALQELDLGDRVVVTGLPVWLPPDGITQLVSGVAQRITPFLYQSEYNAIPELPYQTGIADDAVYGHFDTPGSVLAASITSGATSMTVTTTGDLWTTVAANYPLDLIVDGERMTLTAVSGAANPQTFTVTRAVNGVAKAHTAGTAVAMFFPQVFGL